MPNLFVILLLLQWHQTLNYKKYFDPKIWYHSWIAWFGGDGPILTLYISVEKHCQLLWSMKTDLPILSNSSNEEIVFWHGIYNAFLCLLFRCLFLFLFYVIYLALISCHLLLIHAFCYSHFLLLGLTSKSKPRWQSCQSFDRSVA